MATKSINNTRAVTTLASGITNSATSLTSTDNATTAGFPAAPFTIHIGTEVILVTSVGAGTNWTIQRGYDGTLGAAHDPAAEIAFAVVAEDFAFRYDPTADKYVAQAFLSGVEQETVYTRDTLTVSSGTFEFPMKDSTVIDVRVRLRDAPTGSSVIFDVNKNGTTIFTTQGNRPTVPVASNTDVAIPDVTSFVSGDYLTVDIDQIDSNSVGAGAVLVVRFLEV